VGDQEECRRKCAENSACNAWSWRGDDQRRPCVLARAIDRGQGFAQSGTYSGSMEGRCRELAVSAK